MSSRSRRRQGRRLALVVVPWCFYLGITLVAPALNGATGRASFWEHAAITLAVSGAIAAVVVARYQKRQGALRESRSTLPAVPPSAELGPD